MEAVTCEKWERKEEHAIHNFKNKPKHWALVLSKKYSQGKDTLEKKKIKNPPNTFSLIKDPISLSSSKEMDCRRKGTNEPDNL